MKRHDPAADAFGLLYKRPILAAGAFFWIPGFQNPAAGAFFWYSKCQTLAAGAFFGFGVSENGANQLNWSKPTIRFLMHIQLCEPQTLSV